MRHHRSQCIPLVGEIARVPSIDVHERAANPDHALTEVLQPTSGIDAIACMSRCPAVARVGIKQQIDSRSARVSRCYPCESGRFLPSGVGADVPVLGGRASYLVSGGVHSGAPARRV